MHTPQHALHRQSGMVLIISLIILVLLTIIGVSGMKVTALEEKMAGNDRDLSVSFQSAETALRIGEAAAKKIYEDGDLSKFCDGAIGDGLYYNPTINDGNCLPCVSNANKAIECTLPNPIDSTVWSGANSVHITDDNLLAATGTEASYYITYHYFYEAKDPNEPSNTRRSYYFTVTARGAGTKGGEVILRSYFGGKCPLGLSCG